MHWGLIIKPNRRYIHVVEKSYHITQAVLDISTGDDEPCQFMVIIDGKNFLICTLRKNDMIQFKLDLYFKAGESVAFISNGNSDIHLTGYLDSEERKRKKVTFNPRRGMK